MPPTRVSKGDRLRIEAKRWNRINEAVDQFSLGRLSIDGAPAARGPDQSIRVVNASGVALERFQIVGIDAVAFPPSDLAGANTPFGLAAVHAPDRGERVGVMIEPAADGELGRAVFHGVTACRVKPYPAGVVGPRASAVTGGYQHLVSSPAGPVEVLWHDEDAIEDEWLWALVRLGPAPSHVSVLVTPHEPMPGQTNRWLYAWQEVAEVDEDYAIVEGGMTWETYGLALNGFERPNAATGRQGNDVFLPNPTATVELLPIDGVVVTIFRIGPNRWSFSAPNGISVACAGGGGE